MCPPPSVEAAVQLGADLLSARSWAARGLLRVLRPVVDRLASWGDVERRSVPVSRHWSESLPGETQPDYVARVGPLVGHANPLIDDLFRESAVSEPEDPPR